MQRTIYIDSIFLSNFGSAAAFFNHQNLEEIYHFFENTGRKSARSSRILSDPLSARQVSDKSFIWITSGNGADDKGRMRYKRT